MKILIASQFFNYCSGSAMYVHNLGVELVKRGHEVTVLSECAGEIRNSAAQKGVRCIDFSDVFDIMDEKFDVIHCNQYGPSELALCYFDSPAVFTIHSDLGIETVYRHRNIKKYIAVRDTTTLKHPDLDIIRINFGIDLDRFNTKNAELIELKKNEAKQTRTIVLFVGTIDKLRINAIKDLVEKSETENFDLWIVGQNFLNYIPPERVTILPETFFIEKWVEMADECAGIILGTTAVEGWACGKPYRRYEVNEAGEILWTRTEQVPEDISEYDIKNVTEKIEKVYQEISA